MDIPQMLDEAIRHHQAGRFHQAEVLYRNILNADPRHADAWHLLGMIAHAAIQNQHAVQYIQHAIELAPASAVYHNNLGTILAEMGRLVNARDAIARAIELRPNYPAAHNNLGEIYKDLGRVDDAIAAYRASLRCDPSFLQARSNLLMTLNYAPDLAPETILEEHCQGRRVLEQGATPFTSWGNTPDSDRILRIGYVSPDFRKHAVARFFEPVLADHDRERFMVFLYDEAPVADEVTHRLRSLATGWHCTWRRGAREVAEQVRADGIDILVDLAGHTRNNRLDVFAYKPAPIQATYLGYPNTTGLTRIDYRISDEVVDPANYNFASEKVIRLGDCCWAFRPPDAPLSPSPASRTGFITFGSHHPPIKLNGQLLASWKKVLDAVPDSRLLLIRSSFSDDVIRELRGRMDARGLSSKRIEFRQVSAQDDGYLSSYADVDVVLDAFPFNGHTTTCEALWMGVPVVTLRGDRPSSRLAASVLARVGLHDLIADTPDAYVAIARRLAGDRGALERMRTGLRQRMEKHLVDGKPVASGLEDAYRGMWRTWISQARQPLLVPDASTGDMQLSLTSPQLHERGLALVGERRYDEAIACFQEAIRQQPNYPLAYNSLGNALKHVGRLDESISTFRTGLTYAPTEAVLLSNLGEVYRLVCRFDLALDCFRQAMKQLPPFSFAHNNYLVCFNYLPELTGKQVFLEHGTWGNQASLRLPRTFPNTPQPERKLRVGYISADLKEHPVARFFEPIAQNHGEDFEVFLYAEVSRPDEVSARLKQRAHWRLIIGLDPAEVAMQIREDRIDILVDLTGHYAGSRLDVLAQQPAPIQVTYLGYPNTSGLSAIDYWLTDRVVNPPDEPAHAVEKIVYLEGGFSCFAPPTDVPDVRPTPALATGRVTFGSHHNLFKINDRVLALWKRVLEAVPGSRLLFVRSSFFLPVLRMLQKRFEALGVDPDRIGVFQRPSIDAEYLAGFHHIDIVLDTFPFSGHTMTCEALWMGPPLVTMWGDRPCGRLSASVLTSIGLTDLIAHSDDEYVEIVKRLVGNLDELNRVRGGMRERIRTALCDGASFTRQLEGVYRGMWRDWCKGQRTGRPVIGRESELVQKGLIHPKQADIPGSTDADLNAVVRAARAYHRQGNLAEAERIYRQILASDPEQADACHGLGLLAQTAGRHEQASRLLQQASEQYYRSGKQHRRQGRLAEALALFEQSAQLNPQHADAHYNLGSLLFDLGRAAEALPSFQRAVALRPDHFETHNDMGNVLRQLDRTADAAASYRKALALNPRGTPACANLANLLAEEGRTEEARQAYSQAYRFQPVPRLLLLAEKVLPVIYQSVDEVHEARRLLTQRLEGLANQKVFVDPTTEIMPTHFYLAYQGMNDRQILEAIARIGEGPRRLQIDLKPRQAGKKRIGFLSRYLRNHTIGQLNHGLISKLPREHFEVFVLSVGPPDEGLGKRIQQCADHYLVLPPGIGPVLQTIADLGLDILYLPDIGMDATTYTLAFSRLAPTQVVCWGHPVTTGLPTVDYFITTPDLDPPGNEDHYTEKLARLSRLAVCYERPTLSHPVEDRAALGLPAEAHLYLCPQTLFKFHPEIDDLFAGILRQDERGLLVLIEGKYPTWTQMVQQRFEKTIPDVLPRIRFLPSLPRHRFLNLLALADVMLDPIHFGGGNTSYEGLAFGTPIVTWPSPFLRGRLTYAMYRQMDFLDLVVDNAEDYVRTAVRLGTDSDYRDAMRKAILARCDVLYEDEAIVRELAEFLLNTAET